jgi:hypothetical protein
MTETPKKVTGADIIDALVPPEMALACETAGVDKAGRDLGDGIRYPAPKIVMST